MKKQPFQIRNNKPFRRTTLNHAAPTKPATEIPHEDRGKFLNERVSPATEKLTERRIVDVPAVNAAVFAAVKK